MQNTNSKSREAEKQRTENRLLAAKTQFQYFVVKAENNTYGYDVYADGNLYLHQLTMPGIPGNNGFADTTTAGKVARLVITKIKAGEIPPIVSKQELVKLGVKTD